MNVKVQHTRSQHHTGISFVPRFLSVLTRPNDTSTFSESHQKSAGFYVIVVGEVPDFTADFPQNSNVKYRMLVLIYDKKFLEFFHCCGSFFFNSMQKVQRIFKCSFVIFVEVGKEILVCSNGAFCCVSPVNKHEGGRFIVLICRRLSSIPVCSSATNF